MFFYAAIALIPLFMLMAALFVMFAKRDSSKSAMEDEPIVEAPRRPHIVRGPHVHRATDPSF